MVVQGHFFLCLHLMHLSTPCICPLHALPAWQSTHATAHALAMVCAHSVCCVALQQVIYDWCSSPVWFDAHGDSTTRWPCSSKGWRIGAHHKGCAAQSAQLFTELSAAASERASANTSSPRPTSFAIRQRPDKAGAACNKCAHPGVPAQWPKGVGRASILAQPVNDALLRVLCPAAAACRPSGSRDRPGLALKDSVSCATSEQGALVDQIPRWQGCQVGSSKQEWRKYRVRQ